MCWNPNGDRFGSKSLGVAEWEKGCEVAVEQAQCRRGQLVPVVGCVCRVTGSAVGSGGGGGGGNSGCDGGACCGGVCCGGVVYGDVVYG